MSSQIYNGSTFVWQKQEECEDVWNLKNSCCMPDNELIRKRSTHPALTIKLDSEHKLKGKKRWNS